MNTDTYGLPCDVCGGSGHSALPCMTNAAHVHVLCAECTQRFMRGEPGCRYVVCPDDIPDEEKVLATLRRQDP